MSPNLAGAVLMMVSMACFTINDTLVKATDNTVPLAQLLFLRGLADISSKKPAGSWSA